MMLVADETPAKKKGTWDLFGKHFFCYQRGYFEHQNPIGSMHGIFRHLHLPQKFSTKCTIHGSYGILHTIVSRRVRVVLLDFRINNKKHHHLPQHFFIPCMIPKTMNIWILHASSHASSLRWARSSSTWHRRFFSDAKWWLNQPTFPNWESFPQWFRKKKIWLVVSTHLKNISLNLIISPSRGENKKYLKPPARKTHQSKQPSPRNATNAIVLDYRGRNGNGRQTHVNWNHRNLPLKDPTPWFFLVSDFSGCFSW